MVLLLTSSSTVQLTRDFDSICLSEPLLRISLMQFLSNSTQLQPTERSTLSRSIIQILTIGRVFPSRTARKQSSLIANIQLPLVARRLKFRQAQIRLRNSIETTHWEHMQCQVPIGKSIFWFSGKLVSEKVLGSMDSQTTSRFKR